MTSSEVFDIWRWQAASRCRNAPLDIFITVGDGDDESPYPSDEALWYCNRCDVKTDCLAYAQRNGLVGVYGGTTSYQRSVLKRPMARKGCPGCASTFIVNENDSEVCLTCGLSWYTTRRAES